LLDALLPALSDNPAVTVLLDQRMKMSDMVPPNMTVMRVRPTVLERFRAEKWLAANATQNDRVLCFGNLPPLFKLRGHATVFVQNRYLIDQVSLANFPLNTRLRIQIERLWLTRKAGNADRFVVQTPSMRAILEASGRALGKPVEVVPFVKESRGYERSAPGSNSEKPECDFLYVGSGEPHKNHRRLIEAWSLLAKDNGFPSLWLTLDPDANAGLCDWIEENRIRSGLKVANFGKQSPQQIQDLYGRTRALIYPSTLESFGIPLIEARQAGLPILASELDYVRDVVDPEQVFDPYSAVSIARAVKRFLKIDEPPLQLVDASDFVERLLTMDE
jgi:glycosyltransferase involved in cell wall biosynthesis